MDLEFLGDSFCLRAAGFERGYLTVQFQDGSVYTYENVSPQTYVALKRSVSKGYYFNRMIRNNYSYFQGVPSEPTNIDAKYFEQVLDTAVQVTEEEAGF